MKMLPKYRLPAILAAVSGLLAVLSAPGCVIDQAEQRDAVSLDDEGDDLPAWEIVDRRDHPLADQVSTDGEEIDRRLDEVIGGGELISGDVHAAGERIAASFGDETRCRIVAESSSCPQRPVYACSNRFKVSGPNETVEVYGWSFGRSEQQARSRIDHEQDGYRAYVHTGRPEYEAYRHIDDLCRHCSWSRLAPPEAMYGMYREEYRAIVEDDLNACLTDAGCASTEQPTECEAFEQCFDEQRQRAGRLMSRRREVGEELDEDPELSWNDESTLAGWIDQRYRQMVESQQECYAECEAESRAEGRLCSIASVDACAGRIAAVCRDGAGERQVEHFAIDGD